jgi:shikimate dehydrogenase
MIQLGLTGFPLEHSLSPEIHMAAFKACGIQGNYSLFPIPPDHSGELRDLL